MSASDGHRIERLQHVPIEISVEVGRKTLPLGLSLELRPGAVVSMNRLAGEGVDILAAGKLIAFGELVVIDEEFGVRITDVLGSGMVDPEEVARRQREAAMAEQAAALAALEAMSPGPPAHAPVAGPHDEV
ncbi:MAG: hypothetical protein NVSMB25_14710 [Thermoleophilaceae bacterium]